MFVKSLNSIFETAKIEKNNGGEVMIWCVEDDSSIRDIEVYALSSTGFDARGFEDGDSFWNALQSDCLKYISRTC